MKVLIDECLPGKTLSHALVGIEVSTVQRMGWNGIKNGELLALAEPMFDAFISADQSLAYQQNLADRHLTIIILPSNRARIVLALVPEILRQLQVLQPGDYLEL